MSQTHTQVVIVGGGIVGLCASLFLTKHGIKSLLVEKHSGTSIHPRSRGCNARTMELYRELGLDEAIRKTGYGALSLSGGIYKGQTMAEVIGPQARKEVVGERAFPLASYMEHITPFSGTRGTQDLVEPVLLAAARDRGGDVRFNMEYLSFKQEISGVIVTIRDRATGIESKVQADYMIAADGANSRIRKEIGVGSTGPGSLGHLLNILFEADLTEYVRGREFSLLLIQNPAVRGLLTSIDNHEKWVYHLCYDPKKGEKPEDFTKSRCEEAIKVALGLPGLDVRVKSILPWDPTVSVVEKLQHGRIFLAGDAAHQMPPWGGQGATSGIADVHNLAWKLAAVLNGKTGTKLLETYDTERLPIDRRQAEESGAQGDEYGLVAWKTFGSIKAIIRRLPRASGIGYNYTSGAVIDEDSTPFLWRQRWIFQTVPWMMSTGGTIGGRAPHLWVQHKGKRVSTLDLFGKNFVLITGSAGKAWLNAASETASMLNVAIDAYTTGVEGDLKCANGEWESASWISSTGALLVRPDGMVAWKSWHQPPELQRKLSTVTLRLLCRDVSDKITY